MGLEIKNIKKIRFYTLLIILAYFLIPYNLLFINYEENQDWVMNWVWGLKIEQTQSNKYLFLSIDFPFLFGFVIFVIAILTLINSIFHKQKNFFEIMSSKLIDYGIILILNSLMLFFISLGTYLVVYKYYSDVFDSGAFIPFLSILVIMLGIFYLIIGVRNYLKLQHKIDKEEIKEQYLKKEKKRPIILILKFFFYIIYFLGAYMGIITIISFFTL
ncbi:MAG: hypothetical protein ACFFHD_05880 [Promethearchaeota archaeon]